jgi:hypothetical protein
VDLTKFQEKAAEAKRQRTENLVDLIIRLSLEETMPEVKTLVGHRFPDDDTWLCIWIAKKFIPKADKAEIVFVNAGETLPGSEEDSSVLHFDTGGGEYDQHRKGLLRGSSATLLAKKLGLLEDPGLKPLLEMTEKVDHVKPLPVTSIHFIIEGYPRKFKNTDRTTNWQKVQERVFELFDIVYDQETARIQAKEKLHKYAEWHTLPNGIKVASILWHPECREAAFEAGAYAVVWTTSRGPNHFYTGIQTNRKYPMLFLDNVAAALRDQENKVRRINGQNQDLRSIGRTGPWYLHDSKHLILNGSRTWKPKEEEYTKLAPRQIVGLVHLALSAIPREIVSRWK